MSREKMQLLKEEGRRTLLHRLLTNHPGPACRRFVNMGRGWGHEMEAGSERGKKVSDGKGGEKVRPALIYFVRFYVHILKVGPALSSAPLSISAIWGPELLRVEHCEPCL